MARKRRKRRRAAGAAARPPGEQAARPSPGREGAAPPKARPSRRRGPDEPPPPPWGSFPLVELVVLVAIVLLVAGFAVSGTRGAVMIVTGLALGSLAGLELSIREHLSGYRSHTLVLSGAVAVAVLAALFFLVEDLSPVVRVAAAAVMFGACAWALTVLFRRRSGGLAFRIRGFRR